MIIKVILSSEVMCTSMFGRKMWPVGNKEYTQRNKTDQS